MLTYAQIMDPGTVASAQQEVLDGLQGRSLVTHTGTGTGTVVLSGIPTAAYSVQLEITTSGEPGAAILSYSLDAGATWVTDVTVPSSGLYVLSVTGISIAFGAGPSGATSFVDGDVYSFTLAIPSLPSMSWQDGSLPKTLALIQGATLADQRALIVAIARGGYVTTQPGVTGAAGAWLDLVGQARYQLTRQVAQATLVDVVLTDAGGAGPYTILPGQLWVAVTASLGGSTPLRYSNLAGGTLPQSGNLTLSFLAESPGAAYNAGQSTITTLLSALPGVTCSNSAVNSVTSQGADEETDLAYSLRCLGRWAQLGTGSPAAAYDSWARTASAEVTRTKVTSDGTTAGQIDLSLAGASGGVSAGAVTAVSTYVTPRVSFPATLVTSSATNQAITVTATVYVYTAYAAIATAACEAALLALFRALPIGGVLYTSQIVDVLQRQTGVRNVTLSAPASNTTITAAHVATLAGTRLYSNV